MVYLPLPLENYCTAQEFRPDILLNYPVIKRRKSKNGKKPDIIDCVCAFDIETTNIDEIEQSVMYIWQFQIGTELTVFGRTWQEFKDILFKIGRLLSTYDDRSLVIYVHNLSFEFVFLSGIYEFKPEEVFAVRRRKVLRCSMFDGRFEFRCSYLLSNMTLKAFTKKFHVKHEKLDDFDYKLARYYWSDLTIEEMRYCQNDVLGLVEAIQQQLTSEQDNLKTIPLTSTGYVRRECKKIMADNLGYNFAKKFFPSPRLYDYMKKCFRGGDTHCNRWYCNELLHNVSSYDRSSSYPDVLCNCQFPCTPFEEVLQKIDLPYLEKLIFQRQRAIIMEIRFSNLRLINRYWGDPYLTKDKATELSSDAVIFTGRVLSASTYATVCCDVDYMIIKKIYEWDSAEVITWFKASKDYLPDCFRQFVIKYYVQKTQLKGLTGNTPEETEYNEYLYGKSKNRLNSIYGMTATRSIKENIVFLSADNDFHYDEATSEAELFEKAYKSYWLPFEWGIYCTAYARLRLIEGIELVFKGKTGEIGAGVNGRTKTGNRFSDFVYCDTDSVKFIGHAAAAFEEYNKQRKRDSIQSGAYATDKNGKKHYMGVFERDGIYATFKGCGSKKYAYEEIDENGRKKLHVTIAGVNKKRGAAELAKAPRGIDSLQDGFIFANAGSIAAKYNGKPDLSSYEIDGKIIDISSNVYLYSVPYTVGTMEEYKRILELSYIDIDRMEKLLYNKLSAEDAGEIFDI